MTTSINSEAQKKRWWTTKQSKLQSTCSVVKKKEKQESMIMQRQIIYVCFFEALTTDLQTKQCKDILNIRGENHNSPIALRTDGKKTTKITICVC